MIGQDVLQTLQDRPREAGGERRKQPAASRNCPQWHAWVPLNCALFGCTQPQTLGREHRRVWGMPRKASDWSRSATRAEWVGPMVSVHTAETGKRRKHGSLLNCKVPCSLSITADLHGAVWEIPVSCVERMRKQFCTFGFQSWHTRQCPGLCITSMGMWEKSVLPIGFAQCMEELCNPWHCSLQGVSWHAPHTAAPQGLSHRGCKKPAYPMEAGAFLLTHFLCSDRPPPATPSGCLHLQGGHPADRDSSPFVCHCVRHQSLKQKKEKFLMWEQSDVGIKPSVEVKTMSALRTELQIWLKFRQKKRI